MLDSRSQCGHVWWLVTMAFPRLPTFSVPHNPTLMETGFLDRLANQLKANKTATCRRAIQRILVRIKEHYETGQYKSTTDAENEFRRLVESDLACK